MFFFFIRNKLTLLIYLLGTKISPKNIWTNTAEQPKLAKVHYNN